jgi:hypothetical protein
MPVARRRGYTRAELDEEIKKAEERGREATLRNLEDVIAGKRPKVLTREDVAGLSEAEINSNWDAVCDVLAQEEAEPEATDDDD